MEKKIKSLYYKSTDKQIKYENKKKQQKSLKNPAKYFVLFTPKISLKLCESLEISF